VDEDSIGDKTIFSVSVSESKEDKVDSIGDEIYFKNGVTTDSDSESPWTIEKSVGESESGGFLKKLIDGKGGEKENDNKLYKEWTSGWGTLQIWFIIDVFINDLQNEEYEFYFNAQLFRQKCKSCNSLGIVKLTDAYIDELKGACTYFLSQIGLLPKIQFDQIGGRQWSYRDVHFSEFCCACIEGYCTYRNDKKKRINRNKNKENKENYSKEESIDKFIEKSSESRSSSKRSKKSKKKHKYTKKEDSSVDSLFN